MVQLPATSPMAANHRYRPEHTLLYQLVADGYPAFAELMRRQGRALPGFVHREFVDVLKCARLELGFLRVRRRDCRAENLVPFSCEDRGGNGVRVN